MSPLSPHEHQEEWHQGGVREREGGNVFMDNIKSEDFSHEHNTSENWAPGGHWNQELWNDSSSLWDASTSWHQNHRSFHGSVDALGKGKAMSKGSFQVKGKGFKGKGKGKAQCFNCGQPDHFVRDCPYKGKRERKRQNRKVFRKFCQYSMLQLWRMGTHIK